MSASSAHEAAVATPAVSGPLPAQDPRRRQRDARVLALVVAVAGLVNVISGLTPSIAQHVHLVAAGLTPDVRQLAHGATALLGIALILLARGLAHRRRLAFIAAIALLGISVVTHVAKGLDIEEAVMMLVVAALLVRGRRLFTESTPRAKWQSLLRWVPVILAFDLAYGLLGLALRHDRVQPALTLPLAFREIGARLVGGVGPLHLQGGFGHWFPASITVLGAFSVVAIVLLALAPVAEQIGLHHHHELRNRVRPMCNRADGDTLDPFALRQDKCYVFSEDGSAALAYRYVNGIGLASADPLGNPDKYPEVITRFIEHCDAHGWRPASLGVRHDRVTLWQDAGLRAHYLGDEAIIDVDSFTLEGRAMRPVRQAANRTRNHGITTEIMREGELSPDLRAALQGIAERHRNGEPERGFSMALDGLLSGRDPQCVVIVARDEEGTAIAFQRYVPCKRGTGLSIDAMRRDNVGPNGVNERMIVDIVLWARDNHISEVSLNFAVFKGLIEEGADLKFIAAVEAWLVRRLNPYFQIESLLTFNAKFQPRWVPRYLMYRSAGDLVATGIAAASAEGFMPFGRKPVASVA
ncbi:MAG: bifunctional lysylphosphatidylglycerol flippase/synthetase MprF [Acidimicrobiia bacterium]